jgi:hypothetical protein
MPQGAWSGQSLPGIPVHSSSSSMQPANIMQSRHIVLQVSFPHRNMHRESWLHRSELP